LATVARLAGLSPPPIETARVLEIGAGNAFNTLAMAAAWPDACFTAIDIDPDAVAVGRGWAAESGLGNVEVACVDLCDPHGLAGEYDYVIAHGVYAWVPPVVADALMALAGRVLAPHGVAFVSYNALPGGYVRRALRDRALRASAGARDDAERLARGRAALTRVDPDSPVSIVAAFRDQAAQTLDRPDNVLIHDEMGSVFEPAYLEDFAAHAGRHGLAFLGDAAVGRIADAFVADGGALAAAVEADWRDVRMFRQTLLVRAGHVSGEADLAGLRTLHLACDAQEGEEGVFAVERAQVEIGDPALRDVLRAAIAAWPARLAVAGLELDHPRLAALVRLFDTGVIELHATAAPFATRVGDAPVASALARLAIAQELPFVPTLDGRGMTLTAEAAAVVAACDGGEPARLAEAGRAAGLATPDTLADGLQALARQALFLP
ncbi:MAG TPA: class I SAM-dependent methyltransferase, partial [Sphingomonas sp.]